MHDSNVFTRMAQPGFTAGQPSLEELLLVFVVERECTFKNETYLVRDNGAVFRRTAAGSKRRKYDEVWTFGTYNRSSGYMVVRDHVVHQIVATAFHGPKPSNDHVVDHIDTNRLNNRSDNLRWVTRLENVLLNPITRRRIEIAFGSLEAFFENPGAKSVANWDWMRTVTREQAEKSRGRLLEWAEKGSAGKGGVLGDWLFSNDRGSTGVDPETHDTPSLTTTAFQRRWRTPTQFPQCPEIVQENSLEEYLRRLCFAVVFTNNQYGEGLAVTATIGPDDILFVLSTMASEIKGWAVAKIYLEGGLICHESIGTFFTLQGALKAYCRLAGEPFEESMDDYA